MSLEEKLNFKGGAKQRCPHCHDDLYGLTVSCNECTATYHRDCTNEISSDCVCGTELYSQKQSQDLEKTLNKEKYELSGTDKMIDSMLKYWYIMPIYLAGGLGASRIAGLRGLGLVLAIGLFHYSMRVSKDFYDKY